MSGVELQARVALQAQGKIGCDLRFGDGDGYHAADQTVFDGFFDPILQALRGFGGDGDRSEV